MLDNETSGIKPSDQELPFTLTIQMLLKSAPLPSSVTALEMYDQNGTDMASVGPQILSKQMTQKIPFMAFSVVLCRKNNWLSVREAE